MNTGSSRRFRNPFVVVSTAALLVGVAGCGGSGGGSTPSTITSTNSTGTTASTSATSGPSTPSISVTITTPRNDQKVSAKQGVAGTVSGLPPNFSLWVVLMPAAAQKYYPQTGPLKLQANNRWQGIANLVGTSGDPFTIDIVSADPTATTSLQQNVAKGVASKNFQGLDSLPSGAETVQSVSVTLQ